MRFATATTGLIRVGIWGAPLLLGCSLVFVAHPRPMAFKVAHNAPSQAGMGSGSGVVRTYASPRTAGILDPKAPVIFEDITGRTTLAGFRHRAGLANKDYILDSPSGGVAIFDYDGDGWPDVYLLNGSTLEALRGEEKAPRAALFRNRGNWIFEEKTEQAGVANERWGFGVAVADYDNDGHPDMFVSNYGISRLYHNNGDGTFTDVAEKVGVARKGWSVGPTWLDYDRDGRLDLFVPGYVEFDPDDPPPAASGTIKPGSDGKPCLYRRLPVFCGPRGLKGEGDSLYRQKADGTFEDVSIKVGVHDPLKYCAMSSVSVDMDDDGRPDLMVTNDSTPNYLYRNQGDGTFEDVSYTSAVALDQYGREQASMGLTFGDYNNDGLTDLYITAFENESNTLFRNDGQGIFTDVTYTAGHGDTTSLFVGWGTSFLDYNNDGWKDLIVANGHVYPQVDTQTWGTTYSQQPLLFRNLGTGKFARVGAAVESGLAKAFNGRGLAVGDLDGDGRPDAVINNADAQPVVLHNVTTASGHWLELRLVGNVRRRSPRDATGATARVIAGSLRQRVDAVSGGSFCSQNDTRLHFGLGANDKVDRLEVRWPGGVTEEYPVEAVDRVVVITEGN